MLFGIIEFIRSFIFTGFPWNLIAFSLSDNIYFIQIISVIGTYSFNLLGNQFGIIIKEQFDLANTKNCLSKNQLKKY